MAGMSKLQAVNLMLGNIGESPVSSLVGATGDVFVSQCVNILEEQNAAVQGKKWHFNRDKDYPLTPDGSGNIVITDQMISVDTTARSMAYDVSIRQGKLYNHGDLTFTWTEPVYVDIVWEFEFEELPQYIRHYIAVKAARVFAGRQLGDATGDRLSADDEFDSKTTAKAADLRTKDRNIFDNSNNIGRIRFRRIM